MMTLRLRPLAGLCLGLLVPFALPAGPVPSGKPAAYPDWWFERDVIPRLDPENATPAWPANYPSADDYAAANIGQLKFVAIKAAEELDATLPPPWSGAAIDQLVSAWLSTPPANVSRDDYAALNQGQLKAVARLYYQRLAAVSYAGPPLSAGAGFPWTEAATDDDAYALVNLGQLKRVFSFDPGLINIVIGDNDHDGLPDSWEMEYFTSTIAQNGSSDADGDSLNNRSEYLLGTNPTQTAANVAAASLDLHIFSP